MSALRPALDPRERRLLDLILTAGDLGFRLPVNINLREASGDRDPRLRLRPLLDRILRAERKTGATQWARSRDRLARRLAPALRDRTLLTLVSYSGGALAPDGLPPADPVLAAAFGTLVRIFPRLYGGAVRPLGRLRFISPRRLNALLRETLLNDRRGRRSSGRRPGQKGRELAVDPRLMAAVGRAVGRRVAPGFEARYIFYSKPGDYFWPHPDDPKYHVNVLYCLERRLPSDGGAPSCFYAYRRDGSRQRVSLAPGEAVAVQARGVVHGREPLRRGEKVTLLSIELVYAH